MKVDPIRTEKIHAGASLWDMLDRYIPTLDEKTIVAVTSKIVSLCEGRVVPIAGTNKEALIKREADLWLPREFGQYGYHFSVIHNTIVGSAGIDESNGEGDYILWPKDVQKSANEIREYLATKHGLHDVGVIITDSGPQPMRRGAMGSCLAHSGFAALHNYIGTPDIFDRPFKHVLANITSGLAGAAVLAMGEGAEQTPLCIFSDVPSIEFQQRNPTADELSDTYIKIEDDIFAPFFTAVEWQKGDGGHN